MTKSPYARGVFEDCTVRELPPNTYWMKDSLDRWVILREGTGKVIAVNRSLRKAIDAARAKLDEVTK